MAKVAGASNILPHKSTRTGVAQAPTNQGEKGMIRGAARPRAERRRKDQMIFIERRKGKAWMYGQMAFFVILLYILLRLTS